MRSDSGEPYSSANSTRSSRRVLEGSYGFYKTLRVHRTLRCGRTVARSFKIRAATRGVGSVGERGGVRRSGCKTTVNFYSNQFGAINLLVAHRVGYYVSTRASTSAALYVVGRGVNAANRPPINYLISLYNEPHVFKITIIISPDGPLNLPGNGAHNCARLHYRGSVSSNRKRPY